MTVHGVGTPALFENKNKIDFKVDNRSEIKMGLSAALMQKLANAQPSGGGTFIQHGKYLFIVEQFQIKNGFKGTSFIVELYVAHGEASPDGRTSGKAHNATGSRCSFVGNLTGSGKASEAAAGNLKKLVVGLIGEDTYKNIMASPPAEWNDSLEQSRAQFRAEMGVKSLTDDQEQVVRYGVLLDKLAGIVRGFYVADETYLGTIQSGQRAGQDIVQHRWTYIDTTDAQITENLKLLSSKPATGGSATAGTPAAGAGAPATA